MRPPFILDEETHIYTLDGEVFPSVTTIIKATVPKELAWWGMTVGVDGMCELMKLGFRYSFPPDRPEAIVKKLGEYGLTVNQVMKKAGSRGSAIHRALEKWAEKQEVPQLDAYTEEVRPYIMGLANWLVENEPEIIDSEIITGSIEYHYAGKFDFKAIFRKGRYKSRLGLIDLKTTKRVYPDQHFPQLEAYENAELESGRDATDLRGILHLGSDGKSGLAVSCDSFEDFHILLQHYRSTEDRKQKLRDLGVRQDGMEKVNQKKLHGEEPLTEVL